MSKRDYVLLNYTGHRLYISELPEKNTPKGGGDLFLESLGVPRLEYMNGILPNEDFPYLVAKIKSITPSVGNAVYIVMPEIAPYLCSIRNDVMVPFDYSIKIDEKEIRCRTLARFRVECQTSWM